MGLEAERLDRALDPSLVSAETFGSSLTTRETVFTATPASAATSSMVARRRVPDLIADTDARCCTHAF